MHEFSLAEDILGIALDSAREHYLSRITEVRLDVGKLSGVSLDALRFAWGFLSDNDGMARGCGLKINEPEGRGECAVCGFSGEVTECLRICPSCGAGRLRFTSGEEFMVTGITGE